MRRFLFCTFLIVLVPAAASAQPTPCSTAPADYEGPCFYGALPAIFEDFDYASAPTAERLPERPPRGNLFGVNPWHTRRGVEETRAWYRFNRDDLPVAGSITFAAPSILEMRLPEGLRAEDYPRATIFLSGFTMREGTYHWRVKFGELWPGQALRHTIWTISPDQYFFDRTTGADPVRYAYWSELDIENENHFKGETRGGRFFPDYVPKVQATNHYGLRFVSGAGSRRMSRQGVVGWDDGMGTLVRRGAALRASGDDALRLDSWSDQWWHLIVVVDGDARTVTYRMVPDTPDPRFGDLAVTVGPAFYPDDYMAAAVSSHWLKRSGLLDGTSLLAVDWFHFTPVVGLSDADARKQVAHFQERELPRVNTTTRPTFEDRTRSASIRAEIEGPRSVACGEAATWEASVAEGGTFYVGTLRYRFVDEAGRAGAWQRQYEPTLILRASSEWEAVEIEARFQDLYAPHGTTTGPTGWLYPHPDNYSARTRLTATFDCESP